MTEASARRDSLLRRAFLLRADDLGRRVVSGASYQFLGIVLRTVMTIGSTAILARLLMPADFGYVAMATVVTELAALLGNFGFNALLIQRRVINRLQVDTVFWAAAVTGAALGLSVAALSFFSDHLFADPRVGELLRLQSLTFVVSSLYTVPAVVLARLMRFQFEFWINLCTIAARTLSAICLAYAGFGVWSLVAASVIGCVVQALLGFIAVPYRPRLRFHGAYLADTWRTSSSYFGSGLLYYANMNVDLMLIGRQMGATPLGFYQNARSLTDEIRSRIAMPLQHVLFPAFSSLQNDSERMQAMVLRSGRLLSAITFPIGVGVSAMADELVPLLYGPKWLAMIPVMSMFGISAALRASTAMATPIFNAHNRVGLALRYNVVATAMMVGGIWLTIPFGIEAVAKVVALVSLYALVPFWAALRLVGFGWRQVLDIIGAPAVGSAVLWCAIWWLRPFLADLLPHESLALFVHAGLAAALYLAVLILVSPHYVEDFRLLLARARSK